MVKKKEALEAKIRLRNIRDAEEEESDKRKRRKNKSGKRRYDEVENGRDLLRSKRVRRSELVDDDGHGKFLGGREPRSHRRNSDGVHDERVDHRNRDVGRDRRARHEQRKDSPEKREHPSRRVKRHRRRRREDRSVSSESEQRDGARSRGARDINDKDGSSGHRRDNGPGERNIRRRDDKLRGRDDGQLSARQSDFQTSSNDHRHRSHKSSPSSFHSSSSFRSSHNRSDQSAISPASDSDPLEDLVGPLPASSRPSAQGTLNGKNSVISRGRNAHRTSKQTNRYDSPNSTADTGATAIDKHFDPSYDPSQDHHQNLINSSSDNISIEDDKEEDGLSNWTQSLSSLRNRNRNRNRLQHYQENPKPNNLLAADRHRHHHRLRLLQAGFTPEQVQRWDQSQSQSQSRSTLEEEEEEERRGEKDVRDVKWGKVGQEREWDVGKMWM